LAAAIIVIRNPGRSHRHRCDMAASDWGACVARHEPLTDASR
jgi:hypothetical protein